MPVKSKHALYFHANWKTSFFISRSSNKNYPHRNSPSTAASVYDSDFFLPLFASVVNELPSMSQGHAPDVMRVAFVLEPTQQQVDSNARFQPRKNGTFSPTSSLAHSRPDDEGIQQPLPRRIDMKKVICNKDGINDEIVFLILMPNSIFHVAFMSGFRVRSMG